MCCNLWLFVHIHIIWQFLYWLIVTFFDELFNIWIIYIKSYKILFLRDTNFSILIKFWKYLFRSLENTSIFIFTGLVKKDKTLQSLFLSKYNSNLKIIIILQTKHHIFFFKSDKFYFIFLNNYVRVYNMRKTWNKFFLRWKLNYVEY